jgi:hypothetical protein
MSQQAAPNPLDDLAKLVEEGKRITTGMLNGKISRDDGLFAVAALMQRMSEHLHLFASYALPLLRSIEMMMAEAKKAAVEAQQRTEQPQAPAGAGPGNGAPVQVVDGMPAGATPAQVVEGAPRIPAPVAATSVKSVQS